MAREDRDKISGAIDSRHMFQESQGIMTQPRQRSPGRAHLVAGIIGGKSTIILLATPLSAKKAGEEATVYDIHTHRS